MPNIRKETDRLRIVIVGGGFAGVTVSEDLNRRIGPDVEVVVISSENRMVFTPMHQGYTRRRQLTNTDRHIAAQLK